MNKSHDIYVSVTQRHIDAGKRKDCGACPISLALNECLNPDFHSSIKYNNSIEILFSNRNIPQYAVFSLEICDFVLNFDAGKEVKPFVFVLPNVPERLIKF